MGLYINGRWRPLQGRGWGFESPLAPPAVLLNKFQRDVNLDAVTCGRYIRYTIVLFKGSFSNFFNREFGFLKVKNLPCYVALEKWLNSLAFHASMRGFESRTRYHKKSLFDFYLIFWYNIYTKDKEMKLLRHLNFSWFPNRFAKTEGIL